MMQQETKILGPTSAVVKEKQYDWGKGVSGVIKKSVRNSKIIISFISNQQDHVSPSVVS
jgi:hypothetical protein